MEKGEGVGVALDAVAGVLWRSAAIGYAVLILWLLIYRLAGGWMYAVHDGLFDVGEVDFVRTNYAGMTLLKVAVFALFLTPYISIRWYLAGRK